MKTILQELIDICNEDQVSFTEWFLDNYKAYLEKEKQQIMDAYISGEHQQGFEGEAEAYYNETFNTKDKDELQDDWDVTLNDGIED